MQGAFRRCLSLISVAMPDAVTSIGVVSPPLLQLPRHHFSAPPPSPPICIIAVGSSHGMRWQGAFQGCTSLTTVTMGDAVTIIGEAS